MPTGQNSEKQPAAPVASALLVAKIATGEAEGTYFSKRRKGGLEGGAARASKLSAEQRSEIVRKAAAARWG